MTKEPLISAIRQIFSVADMPSPSAIVQGSSGEEIIAKSLFIHKPWPAIDSQELIYYNNALGYLTDQAFRYYLPAYMTLMLEDIYKADRTGESVINQLTLPLEVDDLRLLNFVRNHPTDSVRMEEFLVDELVHSVDKVADFIRKMDGFTHAQGQCINAFLISLPELYPDYYDVNTPLNASRRYWFKFML